jgi:SAM-dependent methyltransferase
MVSAAPGTRDPQSFDHLVARYDRYAELVGAEVRTWLRFHLPTRAGRGLDAGCGTGLHTALFAERCNEVLAVDVSVPMLDYASTRRPRGNVRYEQRDLHEVTPSQDGPFDVALCAYTLHHVPDFVTALEHLRSLVRPGGTVLLVDVVDERRRVPRAWLRREAVRGFRADLIRRRRPISEAVELLRLQLDPAWLDHQTTDRLWPPDEWDANTRSVFPGAEISELYRARALRWCAREWELERTEPRRLA